MWSFYTSHNTVNFKVRQFKLSAPRQPPSLLVGLSVGIPLEVWHCHCHYGSAKEKKQIWLWEHRFPNVLLTKNKVCSVYLCIHTTSSRRLWLLPLQFMKNKFGEVVLKPAPVWLQTQTPSVATSLFRSQGLKQCWAVIWFLLHNLQFRFLRNLKIKEPLVMNFFQISEANKLWFHFFENSQPVPGLALTLHLS
jgi:hypothetical protein